MDTRFEMYKKTLNSLAPMGVGSRAMLMLAPCSVVAMRAWVSDNVVDNPEAGRQETIR